MRCVFPPLALLALTLMAFTAAPVLHAEARNEADRSKINRTTGRSTIEVAPITDLKKYLDPKGRTRNIPFEIASFEIASFEIASFEIALNISDNVNALILRFGINPGATDGFDAAFDLFAPPPPPAGAFDARLRSNGEDYLTEIKKDSGALREFRAVYQAATGAGSIVISWDPAALAGLGTFEITDNITGALFGPVDMTSTSSIEVSAAGGLLDSGIRIRYFPPSSNLPPTARDDAVSTNEDAAVTIDVLGNDSDDSGLDASSVLIVNSPAKGTITSINLQTGHVTFLPEADFNGPAEFTYTVSDTDSVPSQPATVTIAVNPVNDAPEFTSTPLFAVAENTQYNYVVRTFDVDGDLVTITATLLPSWLSLTDLGNGTATISGIPGPQQQGTHALMLQANDGHGATAELSFSIEVIDNAPPVATRDFATTSEETARDINILLNDFDPEGDALNPASVVIVSPPANGTILTLNTQNGIVTYRPGPGFSGVDSFTYTVADINGGVSNEATVEITVSETNDPPVANDDLAPGNEDSSILIDILSNDVDTDGSLAASTVVIVQSPTRGIILQISQSTGAITYQPNANIFGTDSFSYTVRDDLGLLSNVASVQINVQPVNDPPIFAEVAPASTLRGEPFDFLVSASDVDADVLTFSALIAPEWLSLNDNGNNTATLTGIPSGADVGVHEVTLEVKDPSGSTDVLSTTVTVSDNAPPNAQNDAASTPEDTSVEILVLLNDDDPDGDPLDAATITIVSQPLNGTIVSIDISTGAIVYQPAENFFGVDSFTYVVSDITGSISREATVTITVAAVNDAPVAVDDFTSTDEDNNVVVDLRSNDFDVDENLLTSTIAITTTPSNGSITDIRQQEGTVTYIPANNFFGHDQFEYKITDSSGLSSSATVTIEINPVNDPVEFNSTPGSFATPERMYTYAVVVSDPDGDVISLSVATIPGWMQFTQTGSGRGTLSGTPALINRGIHNVVMEASDGNGSIVNQSFVIQVSENAIPEGQTDIVETDEDILIVIDVLLNDIDPNDDALDPESVTISSPPSHGIIQSIDPTSGAIRYLPNANYFGFDEFMYTVTDVLGGISNAIRVEITIISVNDFPVAALDVAVTDEDAPVIIDVLFNDTDADNESVSVVSFTSASRGAVTSFGDGSFRYVPETNFNGVDHFTYTITDPNGAHSTGNVTVHVLPVNDASEFVSTPETGAVVDLPYNYTIRVIDLDGDQLFISLATQPSWTAFQDNGDGTALLSGTPSIADQGTHRVLVDVFDGTSTVRQIFSIIVGDAGNIPPQRTFLDVAETGTEGVSVNPELTWQSVPGALTYQIQVTTESDDGYLSPIVDEEGLTELTYDLTGLDYESTYRWRVRAGNDAGKGVWSDEQLITTLSEEESSSNDPTELPASVVLYQNFPNPFNPQTIIPFELSEEQVVSLTIFDMLGRKVRTLVFRSFPAGRHEIIWDAGENPSGLYIYRLQAGESVSSKTLSLIR